MSAAVVQKLETFLKRIRKWDSDFLGLGGKTEAFNVPKPEDVLPRVTANLDYFCVNYSVCLALFFLIEIVIYPQLLVLVCVFSGLWYGLYTRPSHIRMQVGAILLTKLHMMYCLAAFNALVVLIFARTVIFASIGASFLFVLAHAGLHVIPANAKGKNGEDETQVPVV
eukprot:TRINITY_DN7644_c2_g1_i1.p1 TRINITY_DN7644_c2_g1~~TRINITY_DN7644_c2_g1_i1.p1  ORF type:complete len:168 (-),score=13.42 TRINITY_DN7644_c2_g1_i1:56-559(-)